jgi:DNA adenine methylase
MTLKPFIKWAGGKRWLLNHVSNLIKRVEYDRLVEPFCGAAALSLGLAPKSAVLNDLNPHLINLLRQVQSGKDLLGEINFQYDRSTFNQHREAFNALPANGTGSPLAAALFYYLLKTGFNGLCRFNQRGEFNTPFGQHKSVNYDFDLLAYAKVMKGWEIHNRDFQQLDLRPTDLLYVDPPYKNTFNQFTSKPFGLDDHYRLAEWASQHNGAAIASNSDDPEIEDLYKAHGWSVSRITVSRCIAADASRRKPTVELLMYRNIFL